MTPLLLLALTAAPPDLAKGPPPGELAKLYFIAGDLLRAQDVLRMGQTKDPKAKAMLPLFVDYQALASKADHLSKAEAKRFIALDRALSPLAMGKMTKPVYDRFVSTPLLKANARFDAGMNAEAITFAQEALDADPFSAEARTLLHKLGVDAGTPPDADAGR